MGMEAEMFGGGRGNMMFCSSEFGGAQPVWI